MGLDEFALPDGDEAEYLLGGLARLIELRGVDTFVAAPVLLPEARFFPDKVETRAAGVSVLLRRLLSYAGLEPLRIDVEIYDAGTTPLIATNAGHDAEAVAWFMDIADGVYHFGVRDTELGDERSLIGTLGHEVAHAYRAHHRLVVKDRELEEKLTDLTTVYLGFGVFILESSFQFRTGHYNSSGQQLLYEQRARGYLLPGQLAFLFGAQLVARKTDKRELKRVLAALSANHGEAVQRSFERFADNPLALNEILRLPPAEELPRPRTLEEAQAPLAPAQVRLHDAPTQRKAKQKEAQVAFRVAGNRRHIGLGLGAAVGFLLALELDLVNAFWPLTIGLALALRAVGRRVPAPTCSACTFGVRRRAEKCRSCSVRLVGDIAEINERFDAEEHYRADLRADAARKLAGIRCPSCSWQPKPENLWRCSCGNTWNTFDTRGECPACSKGWKTTACLGCKQSSPHEAWYPAPTPDAP